eukprot:643181_1
MSDSNICEYSFHSLPLYVIEISIGQFLLPFERRRMRRISKYYESLFPLKTTILTLNNGTHASSSISNIAMSTFWNLIQYLQSHIIQHYFVATQCKISCTHGVFDELSTNDYYMLKYLLIYYDDLRTHECTLTSLAIENGKSVEWNKMFNMLPAVNELCFAYNCNSHQMLTTFMDHIFAFCSNIQTASFFKTLSFCRAGIDDECIKQWCTTMMKRDVNNGYYGIESLDLSFNSEVSDDCMMQLFECIAYKCPKLKVINLSSTSISDTTCQIICDFYQNYYRKKDEFALSLYSINVMRCEQITYAGERVLSAICMEDWRPEQFYIHQSNNVFQRINV